MNDTAQTSLALRSLLFAWLGCMSCSPCERSACDAMTKLAAQEDEARVAGVLASESDVVANDCQECQFVAEALVQAWPREALVETKAQIEAIVAVEPLVRTASSSKGSYDLPLAAGLYFVCAQSSCFNIEVESARTTTLNVRLIDGISSGYLALANAKSPNRVDALQLPPY